MFQLKNTEKRQKNGKLSSFEKSARLLRRKIWIDINKIGAQFKVYLLSALKQNQPSIVCDTTQYLRSAVHESVRTFFCRVKNHAWNELNRDIYNWSGKRVRPCRSERFLDFLPVITIVICDARIGGIAKKKNTLGVSAPRGRGYKTTWLGGTVEVLSV